MDELIERFQGLDSLEMPDVWTEALSREPSPPLRPPTGRRLAIAAFAFGLAAVGIGFAFIALREAPTEAGIGNSSEGLVPSGGTYSLSGFVVEFPSELRSAESELVAAVTYSYKWTSETYPGEAPCEIRLLDAEGVVVAVQEFGFRALPREGISSPIAIPVEGGNPPMSAEGACEPGMVFDGSSIYVFSNVRVEPGRLAGDVDWSGETPVGDAACAAEITSSSDVALITTFTLSVAPFRDDTVTKLSSRFPDEGTAGIRCEPYRVPEQLEESYWLPWVAPPRLPTQQSADVPRWTFAPADGWHVAEGPVETEPTVLVAWTSNVPFDDRDIHPDHPGLTGFPIYTLRSMAPDGIVLTVHQFNPIAATPEPVGDLTKWPSMTLPLRLDDADVREPEAEEPARPMTVYQLDAVVEDELVTVTAYVGSDDPTSATLKSTQEALSRLIKTDATLTILVSSSGPALDTALLTGTLTIERGCVAVSGGPDSSVYVVWPAEYSLTEQRGQIWIVDDSGSLVAQIGDEVQMGGGATNFQHAQGTVPEGIPASCEVEGSDAYWFAGTPEAAV